MSRRRMAVIFGGIVVFGLALLLRPRPAGDDDPDETLDGGVDEAPDAGPRWSDGRPVERAELYPARFEFDDQALTVTLHEAVSPLEAELCHPLARALCEARESCGCAREDRAACEERERALCKRSLACDFWTEPEHALGIDGERVRQCLQEVREDLRSCRDVGLPQVCLRAVVVPAGLGEACPAYGRFCRGGVCSEGVCKPIPGFDQPCAVVRTPGVLPEEDWVCTPGAICEPQEDETMLCVDPSIIEGMPCERSEGCLRGQTCVEGRCGPPRLEGEPCDAPDACDLTLTCRDGVCSQADRCAHYEDCGTGQVCEGERTMRCLPPTGAKIGDACRTTRGCARGLVCMSGFCEPGPVAGQEPIDGRCGACCLAPRGPGTCIARRIRGRGERCDGRRDLCDEGLACVPRTALDGGIALEGFECVSGLGEGAECVMSASRCRNELDCRPEYRNGRCLSTLCFSFANIWSCEGAPTPLGDYGMPQRR